MRKLICLLLVGFVVGHTAAAADKSVNDFPLAVRVVSFSEHANGNKTTRCEDTSIPGPYDKTVKCTTANSGLARTDLQLEIGDMVYQASCTWCPSLSPGTYKGRWIRGDIEFLFTDRREKVRTTRYAIVSAAAAAQGRNEPVTQTPSTQSSAMTVCKSEANVSLSSAPEGAEITVNGLFVGSTPSSIQLSEGEHEIVIQKRGFKAWERRTRITGGKVTIEAELEKAD
jgi:hypothetical protein